jgi:hypothetical protein
MDSMTGHRRIQALQREQQAIRLRLSGATFQAIADHLKISRKGAWKIVMRSMDRARKDSAEQAEQVKELELARLDALLLAHWTDRARTKNAEVILRIMERRARLLGLDAPSRWEGSGPDGGAIPIDNTSKLAGCSDDQLDRIEAILAEGTRAGS